MKKKQQKYFHVNQKCCHLLSPELLFDCCYHFDKIEHFLELHFIKKKTKTRTLFLNQIKELYVGFCHVKEN